MTARVTGLALYQSDRDLLHLGLGYRYTGATNDKLTYKAKPEANTAPLYINTGAFPAVQGQTLMWEGIWVHQSFSLLGEYIQSQVQSPSTQDPRFSAWQLGGSWFLTGENRRYNKTTGNLGKLVPRKNFKFRKGTGAGAVELGARYTATKGSDGLVNGGQFNRFTLGLSWYPNIHFRYSFNYGTGNLDRNGLVGKTQFYQFRIQFEL
ncbi:MAG: hypothetical protein EAZ62_04575 [Sphingobacteriia bacterium]|nr:MAG: hypothetical protein EAZ62_04575 [Sphingobacteriia bacterium]